jgi:PPM family protein phosphatase
MELDWGVDSLQGKKDRPNEDRFRLLHSDIPLVEKGHRGQLFAVFDGIGSAPRGGEAAQRMCDELIRFFREETFCKPDAVSLKALLSTGNMAINSWGYMPGTTRPLGGCAGTIAWFQDARVFLFHAGDTVGYILKGDRISPLTREHGNNKFISNYFGMGTNLLIDSFSLELEEGDTLIMVSDGVTKGLTLTDIGKCVSRYIADNSERAARELCQLARRRGSTDDITALIVEVIEL